MNRKETYDRICEMQAEALSLFDSAQDASDRPLAELIDKFMQDISKHRTALRGMVANDSRKAG
jgi:hypothetical protein